MSKRTPSPSKGKKKAPPAAEKPAEARFPNLFSEFLFYVREGNLKLLRNLLAKGGVDLDAKDAEGNTALHLSCAEGDLSTSILLVDNGASLTSLDAQGYTPILCAAVKGEASVITWLVEKEGATLESRSIHEGHTVFHLCALHGHLPIIQWLVKEQQIDHDSLLDNEGCTPVFYAAKHKNTIVLEFLLNLGVDVNIVSLGGETPLHYGIAGDGLQECILLTEHGADFSLKNKQGKLPLSAMSIGLRDQFLLQHTCNEMTLSAKDFSLWFQLLQVADLPGLEVKVTKYIKSFPTLASAKDRNGREAFRVASKVHGNKTAVMSSIFTLGRYEIDYGPPVYRSEHTVIVSAMDHLAGDISYAMSFRQAMTAQDQGDERWGSQHRITNQQGERCLSVAAFCRLLRAMGIATESRDDVLEQKFNQADKTLEDRMTANEFSDYCVRKCGDSRRVVIKFVRHKELFQMEQMHREDFPFDPRFVLGMLDTPADEDWQEVVDSLTVDGHSLADFPYAMVLPMGDRSVDTILKMERPDIHEVQTIAGQMALALQHLHSLGVIYGDVKLSNVLRIMESGGSSSGAGASTTLLIDLSALVKIDDPFGGEIYRFSTALLPPEMFASLRDEEARRAYLSHWAHLRDRTPVDEADRLRIASLWDRIQPWTAVNRTSSRSPIAYVVRTFIPSNKSPLPYKLVMARPTQDIWAYGVALYGLLTGTNLVREIGRDDDIDDAQIASTIANWTDDDVALEISKHITDPVAADLLRKLLRVKPKERLNSFASVLEHPFFDGWRPVPEPVITEATVGEDGQPMDMATALTLAAVQRAEMVAAMHEEATLRAERWRESHSEQVAAEARKIAICQRIAHLDILDADTLTSWKRLSMYLTPDSLRPDSNKIQPSKKSGKAATDETMKDDALTLVTNDETGCPIVVPTTFVLLPYTLDEQGVAIAVNHARRASTITDGENRDKATLESGGALYTGAEDEQNGFKGPNFVWLDKLAALARAVNKAVETLKELDEDAVGALLDNLRNLNLYVLDEHTMQPCFLDAKGDCQPLYHALSMEDPVASAFFLRVLPHMMRVFKGIFLVAGPAGISECLGFDSHSESTSAVAYINEQIRVLVGRLDPSISDVCHDVLTRGIDRHIEQQQISTALKAKLSKKGSSKKETVDQRTAKSVSHVRTSVLHALEWFFDKNDSVYEFKGMRRVQLSSSTVHPGRAFWVTSDTVTQLMQKSSKEDNEFVQSLNDLWQPQEPVESDIDRLQRENDELRKELFELRNPIDLDAEATRRQKANVFMKVRRMMSKVVPGVEDPSDPLVLEKLQTATNTVMPDFLKATLQLTAYGRQRNPIHAATTAAASVASGYSNHMIEELKNEKEAWMLSKEIEKHEMSKQMQEHIKMIIDDKERWLEMKEQEKQNIINQMQTHLRQVIDDRDSMLRAKDKEIQNMAVQVEQHMLTMASDRQTIIDQKDKEKATLMLQMENQIVREREVHHAREMQMDRENFMLHQQIDFLQLIVADKDADQARARRGGGLGSNALGIGIPAESTDSFGSYLRKAYGNNKRGTRDSPPKHRKHNRNHSGHRSRPASPGSSMIVESDSYSLVQGTAVPFDRESSDDERLRVAYTGLMIGNNEKDGSTDAVLRAEEDSQHHLITAFRRDGTAGRKKGPNRRPHTASP